MVSLLCFVIWLVSSSQGARSRTRGGVGGHTEGCGGSSLSGKVYNTEDIDTVYKYLKVVNIFQSQRSLSPVPCTFIFYHFSCLTRPLFPLINYYLTPVAVEYLLCSSSEG